MRVDSPEGQLAFSPVGAAPVVPTVTAVDTVTYVNAWPGADLRYQVLGDEVKETIVLNRRPTAATFAFTTAGLGFTTAAGGALAPKRAKSNWTLTSPLILDKQGTPLPDAPVTLNQVGAAANAGLAVTVSPSWLAAQPDSAFPILVDLGHDHGIACLGHLLRGVARPAEPRKPVTSPAFTSKKRPSTANVNPYCLVSFRASIMAGVGRTRCDVHGLRTRRSHLA